MRRSLLLAPLLLAQAEPQAVPAPPAIPDWALPTSPGHVQGPPPAGFHRAPRTEPTPIGLFEGQSDVGAALVPGAGSLADGAYRITSAGYNIWYNRDEFRFLWRRMRGDVSLAADVSFPDPNGYADRKAVLMIRQSLDDEAPAALVALHGGGMIQLASRTAPGALMTDTEYRIGGRGSRPGGRTPDSLVTVNARRIGIEKRGDTYQLFVSAEGEPMHAFGAPLALHLAPPFYVGIGFCSHLPATPDTAVLSRVTLANAAGRLENRP